MYTAASDVGNWDLASIYRYYYELFGCRKFIRLVQVGEVVETDPTSRLNLYLPLPKSPIKGSSNIDQDISRTSPVGVGQSILRVHFWRSYELSCYTTNVTPKLHGVKMSSQDSIDATNQPGSENSNQNESSQKVIDAEASANGEAKSRNKRNIITTFDKPSPAAQERIDNTRADDSGRVRVVYHWTHGRIRCTINQSPLTVGWGQTTEWLCNRSLFKSPHLYLFHILYLLS